VEFKAFGESQILDLFVANKNTNVIMLLLCVDVIFVNGTLDRNSKVYGMVPLYYKCHNFSVFRLRMLNSICTSSDEKITGESKISVMTNIDETVEDEGGVTELTPRYFLPAHLEPAVSKYM